MSKVGLLHVPRPMNNFCVTHVSFFMKFMGAKNENEFHNAVNQMTPKSDNGIRREGFTKNRTFIPEGVAKKSGLASEASV